MTEGDGGESAGEVVEANRSDPSRERGPKRPFQSAAPGHEVPCRGCGQAVMVSGFVLEFARSMDRYLADKNEPPLADNGLTLCRLCAREWHLRQSLRARATAERVAAPHQEGACGRVPESPAAPS